MKEFLAKGSGCCHLSSVNVVHQNRAENGAIGTGGETGPPATGLAGAEIGRSG